MIDLIIRNIRARKIRSILTIAGVAICIFMSIFITTGTSSIEFEMEGIVTRYAGQIYVTSKLAEGFPPIASVISTTIADEILEETEGIDPTRSTSILFASLEPSIAPYMPPTILAVGVAPGKEKAYIGEVEAASGASSFSSEGAEIILGNAAADFYEVEVGQSVTIMGRPLKVIGILQKSGFLVIDGTVLIPLSYSQLLFHREGTVSCALLTAESVGFVSEIAESINDRYPELQVITQEEMAESIDKQLSGMRMWMGMISVTALAVAMVIIMVVMTITVIQRTREIGTLRAIGAKRRTILSLILGESFILSLFGCFLGIALAFIVLVGWGWDVSGLLEVWSRFLLVTVASGCLVGVVAGLYPAYRASKVSPMEALRYE